MYPSHSVLFVCCFSLVVGCTASGPDPKNGAMAVSGKDRPPLRICLVETPELEEEISIRWKVSSDQPIVFENLSSNELIASDPVMADVLIYPGNLIGDLVLKEVIGRLPSQAIRRDQNDEDQTSLDLADSWPVRWRDASTFANQRYAIPLGVTKLGAIMRGLNPQPMIDLAAGFANQREQNKLANEQWNRFLEPLEAAMGTTQEFTESELETKLSTLSPVERNTLLDRFIWVASTTMARRKGFFDLAKMKSRLAQPEFSLSVKTLARLVRIFPSSFFQNPNQAWDSVAFSKTDKSQAFAIGWPSPSPSDSADSHDVSSQDSASSSISVSPFVWSSNQGILASMGKKTRQTSVSAQFLAWISEPEQRESLRAKYPRIELLPSQRDRNTLRTDYRDFQSLNDKDSQTDGVDLSLRMANADQYRSILADALIQALCNPNDCEQIMARCSDEWNSLTDKLGLDSQRKSQEQSLGFSN